MASEGSAATEPLIRLRGFSLARRDPAGETSLLQDVDLDVRPGRWLAIAGANGAGKSSLLKYLAGDESPVAGRAALVAQDPDEQLVAGTVAEELALGRAVATTEEVLAAAGLPELGDRDPRVLSAGQKQRLALAAALGQDPGVLLCDEPTALQDPTQATWMLDRLQAWLGAAAGRALVTATCDRSEAVRADELLVIDGGRVVRCGPPGEVLADPLVDSLLPVPPPPTEPCPGDVAAAPVLEVAGLVCGPETGAPACGPLDLKLHPGERIGLTGPNGCGKSTLLAACVGLQRPRAGRIVLDGETLYRRSARDLTHGRAALAPQFPEYMFTAATVRREIALDPGLAGREPSAFVAELGLPDACLEANPHALSTGQRRRLALGLVLGSGRRLLAVDEPTAALDRAGRRMVLDLLGDADPGAGLLLASHDRAFLAAAGCRIVELGASSRPR